MPSENPGMEFSTAKSIIQEIIRQERGLTKLHEVLEAAVRAQSFLRTAPGDVKGLEKKRDGLKTEVKDLEAKVKAAGNEWVAKTEEAKRVHANYVSESAKAERDLRKLHKDLKKSFETSHATKMARATEEIAASKKALSTITTDRNKIRKELDELTEELSSIMSRFSGPE